MDGLEGVADTGGLGGTQVTERLVVPFWSSASEHMGKEMGELIYTMHTILACVNIYKQTYVCLKSAIW